MNKTALTLATAISIISLGAFAAKSPASNGGQVSRPYEWTIEIDTKEMPRQFQYHGSNISQIVKAQLMFYSMNRQNTPTAYEDLWYSNAKSLGLERHNKLGTNPGDAIAIRVVHKGENSSSPTNDEQRAAGKAVMKAVLDATINKNMVATIRVPMVSFRTIAAEIQNYNFSIANSSGNVETPVNSDMNLFLESEPPGLTQSFEHYH